LEFAYIYILIFAASLSAMAALLIKRLDKKNVLTESEKTPLDRFTEKKAEELLRSGTGVTLQQYFAMILAIPAVLAFSVYLFMPSSPGLAILAAGIGFFAPDFFIRMAKGREDGEYSERFSAALNQMAASLTAGLTFGQAIDAVIKSELVNRQVRDDFMRLSSDIKLGMPIPDAFYAYAARTQNEDVYDVATAVSIMLEIGKDEGQGIRQIQKNIEDRMLYRKKRKAMMVESRLLSGAAAIIPAAIIVLMFVMMPDSVNFYFSGPSNTAMFFVLVAMPVIGAVIVRGMLKEKKLKTSASIAVKKSVPLKENRNEAV